MDATREQNEKKDDSGRVREGGRPMLRMGRRRERQEDGWVEAGGSVKEGERKRRRKIMGIIA